MAGSYARQVLDTVDIHFQTVATAVKMKEAACRVNKPRSIPQILTGI